MGHVPSSPQRPKKSWRRLQQPCGWGWPPGEEADSVTAGPLLSGRALVPASSPAEPRASEARPGAGHPARVTHLAALPVPARMGRVGAHRAGVSKRAEGKGAAELGAVRGLPSPAESTRSLGHPADHTVPYHPRLPAPPGQSCGAVSSDKRPQPLMAQRAQNRAPTM